MFSRLSLGALLLALGACKTVSPHSRLDIVGGKAPDAGSPTAKTTVALVDAKKSVFCSGSVIADNLILTAAHCVDSYVDSQKTKDVLVMFEEAGVKKYIENVDIQMFRPKGAMDFPQHDVAWIKLKEAIPTSYKPISIWQDSKALNAAVPMMLAGYGKTKTVCPDDSCFGKLLETPTTLERYFDEGHLNSLLLFHGTGNACNGDSGGSAFAFIGDEWRLIGVASGLSSRIVPEAYIKGGNQLCESGYVLYNAAGDYASWIETSSGVTLSKSPENFQSSAFVSGLKPSTVPANDATWKQWLDFGNFDDPIWTSVEYLQYGILRFSKAQTIKNFIDEPTANGLAAKTLQLNLIYPSLKLSNGTPEIPRFQNFLPFQALRNLEILSVGLAKDADFATLMNLPKLIKLDLWYPNNQEFAVKNLESLKNLSSLQILSLQNIDFSSTPQLDLSGMAQMSSLSLSGKNIVLPKLPVQGLEALTLEGSLSQVATILQNLPKTLTSLTIHSKDLTQLPDLSQFPKLVNLDVSSSAIQDFAAVAKAPALKSVKAVGNAALQAVCPKAATACAYDSIKDPQSMMDFCINWMNKVPGSEGYGLVLKTLTNRIIPDPGLDNGFGECASIVTKAESLTQLEASFEIGFDPNLQLLTLMTNLTDLTIKNARLSVPAVMNGLKAVKNLRLLAVDFDYELTLADLESLEIQFNNAKTLKTAAMPKLKKLVLRNAVIDGASWNTIYPALEELYLSPSKPLESFAAASLPIGLRRLEIDSMPSTGFDIFKDVIGLDVRVSGPASNLFSSCPVMMGSCIQTQGKESITIPGPRLGLKQAGRLHRNLPGVENKESDLPGL